MDPLIALHSLEHATDTGLQVLTLVGVAFALVAVASLALSALRSLARVLFSRAIMIVPFRGSDHARAVSSILGQQLTEVEREWLQLSRSVRHESASVDKSDAPARVDLGASAPDRTLTPAEAQVMTDERIDWQGVAPVGLGPISVPLEALLAPLYEFRAALARGRIEGTLHEFDTTVRVAAVLARRGRRSETVKLVRLLEGVGELVEVVDDLAFELAKRRLDFETEAATWRGYRTFLDGYFHHLRFLRTGSIVERETAVERYESAVQHEPDYHLGRYNLGTLLYNRYTREDNEQAMTHLEHAARTRDPELKARAFAGQALAYCQQVHRYGDAPEPWAHKAEQASFAAVHIAGDLEESCFARAWAHQVNERVDDAIEWYRRVVELPGDTWAEKQVKSFALNNWAYLLITDRDHLDEAEALLEQALDLYDNKIVYANLGDIAKRRGDFPAAVRHYGKALDLDPGYVNAVNELGMVYVASAEAAASSSERESALREARRWHQRALGLSRDPRQRVKLQENFAKTYREHGFVQEADDELASVAS